MLHTIQFAVQHANPYVINALTNVHGLYMNVYDKAEKNIYDEGRDNYISNATKFSKEPRYRKKKLLLYEPVQETFDSGVESFDSYMNDTFILTCDKSLVFEKEQKFEIFYDKLAITPQRVMQCFEVREISNSHNQWSVRKIMLRPFN
mgnify:CR=1 FL=1